MRAVKSTFATSASPSSSTHERTTRRPQKKDVRSCTYGTSNTTARPRPAGRGHLAGRARRRRPHPGRPARRPPRWPTTPGPPTRRSGTGSRVWCDRRGVVDPLDAGAAQVAAYLTERAETRKLSTVQASAAAIAAAARSAGRADPTKTPLVADTLRGIARQHAAAPEAAPRQAAALDYVTAIELMRAAARPQRRGRGRETSAAAEARGQRDAAIVALAFCAGLRRSEIAALVWDDITPTARAGQLRVRVRASKGRREDLRLLAGPFARVVDQLCTATSPAAADRVVPLVPHQVNRRLQVLAAMLGLKGVSSHSGRRGLASELVRRGASTTAVQLAGGWRSAAMVARYASAVAVEDGAVARLFGGSG